MTLTHPQMVNFVSNRAADFAALQVRLAFSFLSETTHFIQGHSKNKTRQHKKWSHTCQGSQFEGWCG